MGHHLGQQIRELWLKRPNISEAISDVLRKNFDERDHISIELIPEASLLTLSSVGNTITVKLSTKNRPKHFGYYNATQLRAMAPYWSEDGKKILTKLNDRAIYEVVYYPDFQLLEIASLPRTEIHYVDRVQITYEPG